MQIHTLAIHPVLHRGHVRNHRFKTTPTRDARTLLVSSTWGPRFSMIGHWFIAASAIFSPYVDRGSIYRETCNKTDFTHHRFSVHFLVSMGGTLYTFRNTAI